MRGRGRDPDRAADAALAPARARPLDRRGRDARNRAACCARASSSCSSRRRTPARRARCCSRSSRRGGAQGRRGLPPRLSSPERVDPGREDWTTKTTPKVVGGITPASHDARGRALRRARSTRSLEVSTPEAAELTKLLENIFRSVNIALVNELAQLCDRMGIDVWEVVDAAATKPFGFMRFSPGPGLGGHCIPIDPFYLTWKAREFDFYTEFIELAGKVNEDMPYFCRSLVSQALNHGAQKSLKGSKILVLGVAYKPDIDDMRESPAVKLIELLRNAGADVSYHDPHVPELRGARPDDVAARARRVRLRRDRHRPLGDRLRRSSSSEAKLVVDLRNATGQGARGRRQGLEALMQGRRGGPRLLGPEPRAQLRRARRARLALRPRRTQLRASSPRATRTRACTATSTRCSPTTTLDARRDRDAGADALRAREAGARGRQARPRREAARDARGRDGRARRARRRRATSC